MRARLGRSATIAAGTAGGLALALYPLLRPRWGALTGTIELLDDFAPWGYAAAPALGLLGLRHGSAALTLSALAAGTAFGLTWGPRYRPPVATDAGSLPQLTVMTFNLLKSNTRYDKLAGAIAAADADVVAVQEPSEEAAAYLVRVLDGRYPHRQMLPASDPSGVGVLSRYPLRDGRSFLLSPCGHRSMQTVVDTPAGAVTLFNIHTTIPGFVWSRPSRDPLRLPIAFSAALRRSEIDRLVPMLDQVENPCLVVGDLNMTERSPDYRVLRARLGDAYRAVGRGLGHTFPQPTRFPRKLPIPWPVLRLDYVWHSAHFRPLSAQLGRDGGSDHRGVVVRLAVVEGGPAPRA